MNVTTKASADYAARSVDEAAYEFLRDQIVAGQLAPGAELQLAPIASVLGFSTMPVRNAIAKLTSEGLVTSAPRRRARVAELSFDDFKENIDIRCAIESLAAEIGIDFLTDEDIARMQSLHDQFLSSGKPFDEYMSPEWDSYLICFSASGRPRMLKMILELRQMTERYIRLTLGGIKTRRAIAAGNLQRFIDAARAKDKGAARAAIAAAHAFSQEEVKAALVQTTFTSLEGPV